MARTERITEFYSEAEEDSRLIRSCHGRLEYAVTMHYIRKYLPENASVLEIGAARAVIRSRSHAPVRV